MAKTKAKVKGQFTHQGKTYKPGEEFEGEAHEIETLAAQGHLEHPHSQQTIGQQHGPSGQTQGQGAQPPHEGGPDPSKQGR